MNQTQTPRFTKIKLHDGKVRLEYDTERAGSKDRDEFAMTCVDAPRPEFARALAALDQDVATICELGSTAGIAVRSVTLTWTNGIMGACITALKSLKTANSPLVLNTPHLPSESYSGEDNGTPTLPAATIARIDELIAEADAYVRGDRAQISLLSVA